MASTERPLSGGERKIIASVFGDALDPAPVRIFRRKWWPFQPRNVLMAPCGHLHVPAKSALWSDDYSAEDVKLQGLFVHEMTHIWQAQTKGRFYLPLMRHPFCRYAYKLTPGRAFGWYGIEQQAEIVRHAFIQRIGWTDFGAPPLEALEKLLPFAAQAASLGPDKGDKA
jgi:hypothetical protein